MKKLNPIVMTFINSELLEFFVLELKTLQKNETMVKFIFSMVEESGFQR